MSAPPAAADQSGEAHLADVGLHFFLGIRNPDSIHPASSKKDQPRRPPSSPPKATGSLLHHLPYRGTKIVHPILLDLVFVLLILKVRIWRKLILIVHNPSASFLAFAEFLFGRPSVIGAIKETERVGE